MLEDVIFAAHAHAWDAMRALEAERAAVPPCPKSAE
jgi:hypothetical protein